MTDHSTPRPGCDAPRPPTATRGRGRQGSQLADDCRIRGAGPGLPAARGRHVPDRRRPRRAGARPADRSRSSPAPAAISWCPGPTSLVLFPAARRSRLRDVASRPRPDMGGAPTLAVQTLEAELGLMSLFTRQAGVKRLVLTRPVIELRVDAQGRRSWDFALAAPDRRGSRNRPRAATSGRAHAGFRSAAQVARPARPRQPRGNARDAVARSACASSRAACAMSTSAPGCATM